jgi:orotidine-5'-phosphate decarboxylase
LLFGAVESGKKMQPFRAALEEEIRLLVPGYGAPQELYVY